MTRTSVHGFFGPRIVLASPVPRGVLNPDKAGLSDRVARRGLRQLLISAVQVFSISLTTDSGIGM
jgi:hypothetical protein